MTASLEIPASLSRSDALKLTQRLLDIVRKMREKPRYFGDATLDFSAIEKGQLLFILSQAINSYQFKTIHDICFHTSVFEWWHCFVTSKAEIECVLEDVIKEIR